MPCYKTLRAGSGRGIRTQKSPAGLSENRWNQGVAEPVTFGLGASGGASRPTGTIAGTNLEGALRAAVIAAVTEARDDVAAELLALLARLRRSVP